MSKITKSSEMSSANINTFRELSKQGLSLIQLKDKAPIKKNWQRWCENNRKFEEIGFQHGDNAGVTCGPASRIIVLDIDNQELFTKVCHECYWKIPETYTIKTGNGGTHYYFQYPNDGKKYGNRSFKGLGFDIRGKGGQVVAPGSIHPDTGKQYVNAGGSIESIAEAPDWLLKLYEENKHSPITPHIIPAKFDVSDVSDINSKGLSDRIKKLITKGAPKGKRSEAIMTVIDSLVTAGLSDEQIFSVFREYPIGKKYLEKGNTMDKWLQTHIDKARVFVNNDIQEKSQLELPSSLPEFPLDYFPECYQKAIIEIADAIGAPVEIPALALISAVGASIGRAMCVIGKEGWKEYPNLYIAIIGTSGTGKTPAVNKIFEHVHKIEEKWYNE